MRVSHAITPAPCGITLDNMECISVRRLSLIKHARAHTFGQHGGVCHSSTLLPCPPSWWCDVGERRHGEEMKVAVGSNTKVEQCLHCSLEHQCLGHQLLAWQAFGCGFHFGWLFGQTPPQWSCMLIFHMGLVWKQIKQL